MRAPALVVAAAGESARLGTCKALVRLRAEEPATPLALLLAAGACLDDVPALVVAGAHAAEIAGACPRGVELVTNPDWRAGRTGGLARAAAARAGRDLCIAPVDVPLVPARVFEALREAWREAGAPPRGWLGPRVGGAHGHPIVLGRELAAELAELDPDTPLRALRDAATPLWDLEVDEPAVLDDLDDPADLERLRARLGAAATAPRDGQQIVRRRDR